MYITLTADDVKRALQQAVKEKVKIDTEKAEFELVPMGEGESVPLFDFLEGVRINLD